jgi:hypothetical protein
MLFSYHHSGCSDAIVPTSSLHPTTIAVFDSSSYLLSRAGNATTYEMFKINETDQLVNSSLCHISSLEVYRGRDQAIEISHQGFSLNENGSIKVHKNTIYIYLLRANYYYRLLQVNWGMIRRIMLVSSIALMFSVLVDYQRVGACSLQWSE